MPINVPQGGQTAANFLGTLLHNKRLIRRARLGVGPRPKRKRDGGGKRQPEATTGWGSTMSVSIGVVATVLHLTIGNVTEQEMAPYVWEMLGLCKAESGTARESCEWSRYHAALSGARGSAATVRSCAIHAAYLAILRCHSWTNLPVMDDRVTDGWYGHGR